MPTPREENGVRFYTLADVMTVPPADYETWVYAPQTERVDEVRLYPGRLNRLLNRWPPWVPLLFLPVAAWLARSLEWPQTWALLLGVALFPLVEVGLHRFIFHLRVRGKRTQRMHLVMHGGHHLAPSDVGRLTAHPLMVVGYIGIFYGLLWLLEVPLRELVVAGLLVSYVRYDMTHVMLHVFDARQLGRVPLVGGFLRRCKRHHMVHHFADATRHYAISFYIPGPR